MNISDKIQSIKKELPNNVTLVAVSKTKSEEEILQAYNSGHKIFGENKVQELVEKYENLPKDIEWHMIGHLQRNKVKYIAPFVSLIHAVDSLKLVKEINKRAEQNNRVIDCLLQVHIASESTKFGFGTDEIESALIEVEEFKTLNPTAENICVVSYNKLRKHLPTSLDLEITLYETPRNFVKYSGE